MRTRASLMIGLLAVTGLALADEKASTYQNPIIGTVRFGEWSAPVNGLQCRIGTTKTEFLLGAETPVVVLQAKNLSSDPVAIDDLFSADMLVYIEPSEKTYYGNDFQWIYDPQRQRRALNKDACIEAACRIPAKLLYLAREYKLSIRLQRGVHATNSHGEIPRPSAWWAGMMETPAMTIEMK